MIRKLKEKYKWHGWCLLIKMNWPALESDPEIFTNYFRQIGLSPNWEFAEVFTLEIPVPGSAIILAYRSAEEQTVFQGEETHLPYFIRQIDQLDNSCGLLAAVHSILNTDAEITEGSLLANLKEGITEKNPVDAAHWLMNHQELNNVHSNFASQGQSESTDEPNHHFIAIIPGLKLIDGMKESPLTLAGNAEGDFSMACFAVIQQLLESGRIGQDISMISLQRIDG